LITIPRRHDIPSESRASPSRSPASRWSSRLPPHPLTLAHVASRPPNSGGFPSCSPELQRRDFKTDETFRDSRPQFAGSGCSNGPSRLPVGADLRIPRDDDASPRPGCPPRDHPSAGGHQLPSSRSTPAPRRHLALRRTTGRYLRALTDSPQLHRYARVTTGTHVARPLATGPRSRRYAVDTSIDAGRPVERTYCFRNKTTNEWCLPLIIP